jgi:hypothetical protein
MGSATLHWYSDRGFELDLEAAEDDVAIRLAAVPVPADGTAELRSGVDLDRLDILFKAVVEINGEPAQLHDARVQLVEEEAQPALSLDAKCEDAETGEIVPVRWTVQVQVPDGVPLSGGPRPVPTNEDDLDWEDETTLEQLVVNAPETPQFDDDDERLTPPSKASAANKGLQALLQALARVDDDEANPETPTEDRLEPEPETPPEKGGRRKGSKAREPKGKEPKGKGKGKGRALVEPESDAVRPQPAVPQPVGPQGPQPDMDAEASGPDQSLGADAEAKGLLDLLVDGGNLELEDDAEVDGLIPGVKKILSLPLAPEAKASRLSSWLLGQEEVADLFIGDDDLAEILERW